MKVFKFGGGILDSAEAVRRIPGIIRLFPSGPLVIVVSAFGKTTNALEELINAAYHRQEGMKDILDGIIRYQDGIFAGLFPGDRNTVRIRLQEMAEELSRLSANNIPADYAEFYDRLVCYGELMSSLAVHHALLDAGIANTWLDVRKVLATDSTFRDASVDWTTSLANCREYLGPLLAQNPTPVIVTQGFIGADPQGRGTSLGREGSDYTASIFANLLDADSVVIWKDVPGILNADPKHFRQTVKLDEISYAEATELAYYGAKVIHPKTVKPLQNKNIPLYVRHFHDPESEGTCIHANAPVEQYIPSFIFKPQQVLISISHRDLSFVDEQMFSDVFSLLTDFSIHMNLVQNSALTLTFCMDDNPKLEEMIGLLKQRYVVRYNRGLELITIRHYNEKAAEAVLQGKEVIMEQQNRTVMQYVIR